MELLDRSDVKAITSDRGAEGLAVPVVSR
jgi:hypothetical protein